MSIDERTRLAISIYVDGEADNFERETAEKAIREDVECKKYFEELKKLSGLLKQWPDEELSTDLKRKFESSKNRKGASMKNVIPVQRMNFKALAAVAAGVTALVLVNHLPSELKSALPPVERTASVITAVPVSVTRQVTAPVSTRDTAATSPAAVTPVPVDKTYSQEKLALRMGASMASLREERDYLYSNVQQVAESAGPSVGRGRLAGLDAFAYRTNYIGVDAADFDTENYNAIEELSFRNTLESPLSTFSIDVDTASYANVRRFLNEDRMPPQDAVRIEEMINYFAYDYPEPKGGEPFSVTTEIADCPWAKGHELVLVGLKGRSLDKTNLPPSNLVFLVDVSGSMDPANRLPLLQKALSKMVNQLGANEKVAIVTYAGNAGLVLPLTSGNEKSKILAAIDDLRAGGSTAGGQGIELAYRIAKENFIKDGNNRVILATDGDFNVGVSSDAALVRLIEEKRGEGVFLTVLGFGTGNLKDSKMEQLANKGNGNYFYIDSIHEAQKVLVQELGSTLFTIAKDVKIQVEFNPAYVKSYRLVGYENRALANEDFNNDKKDAGELGAGHTVTALYEIVPADSEGTAGGPVDALKYQTSQIKKSDDLLTVKLRYKEPNAEESKLIAKTLSHAASHAASANLKLASGVAEFGLLLRKSAFKAASNYSHVLETLKGIQTEDAQGRRAELIKLVEKAQSLDSSTVEGIQFKS